MSKRPEPSIEWYKETLEHFTAFIQEQIHPDYGPCDGLGEGGNCSVCLEVIAAWKGESKWTRDKPTTEGVYLYWMPIEGEPRMVKVANEHIALIESRVWFPFNSAKSYFYGPIELPEFNEDKAEAL